MALRLSVCEQCTFKHDREVRDPSHLATLTPRQLSGQETSSSGRTHVVCRAVRSHFDASKLSVSFLGLAEQGPTLPAPRRYTLTHSDFSGKLFLSIGQSFDEDRLSNWYLKLIRDEVLAEWIIDSKGSPQLHIFCHISSERRWSSPIPPAMRSRVFQHEMPLVLQAIRYGDSTYLQNCPDLLEAQVVLHLASHLQGKYMEATKTEYASALVEKCPAVRKLDPASQRQVTITGFAGRSLFSTDHHDRLKTHRKTYPSSR